MLMQSFWKMYAAGTSLECFTPFNSSCMLMIRGKFHDVASGVFLSFVDNYDECWLSKLRPSDKWMDGWTDRWIFDVARRPLGTITNARMIYQHISLFLMVYGAGITLSV